MNTYLKYQPAGLQLLAFLAFSGGCFLLSSLLSYFFFSDVFAIMLNTNATVTAEMINKFRLAQLFSALISFLIPALLFGYYSSPKSVSYLGIRPIVTVQILGISILLFICIQPFIGYLGHINSNINFGSFQKYIDDTEKRYERALKIFLQMPTPADFILNIILMSLVPALSEELFFRGALQKVLIRFTKIPWLGISISALIFALLHGTMLKIIPIFALGLMLGFIYYITRNLIYTIILHFINNSFALIAVYFSDKNELLKKMADDSLPPSLLLTLLGLLLSAFLVYRIQKLSNEAIPHYITDEDNDYIA